MTRIGYYITPMYINDRYRQLPTFILHISVLLKLFFLNTFKINNLVYSSIEARTISFNL